MRPSTATQLTLGLSLITISFSILAHDPVFGIGPHVLFKGGTEAALKNNLNKRGDNKSSAIGLELAHGITGDWSVGVELPYAYNKEKELSSSGLADIQLFTKYRFWRKDAKGLQESAAIMLAANLNNGDANEKPKLGNGANDFIAGLTYGYESLTWYRWASVRYRYNGENDAELRIGNKTLIDFVIGWRPTMPEYKKPDTVWLLELNNEISNKSETNGNELANTGGIETFISPGIFWTMRNFAIVAGIQIPLYNRLNGSQIKSGYRVKVSFEWHF